MHPMTKPNPLKVALRPLPMRITPIQYTRLQNARIADGRTIQEHIRKALDLYLDGLDRATARANGATAVPAAASPIPMPAQVPAPVSGKIPPPAARARRPAAPAVRQR